MTYEITGEPTPVVICELESGEQMITERGSMAWMSPNMRMETGAGGFGKAFGRLFSGESIFQNTYTAERGRGLIAFASSFPGAIKAVRITPDCPIVVQKSAFLRVLPEALQRRALLRRGLHTAAAQRQRHGLFGDRRHGRGV